MHLLFYVFIFLMQELYWKVNLIKHLIKQVKLINIIGLIQYWKIKEYET